MHLRLLKFLRCPECGGPFELMTLAEEDGEVSGGLLHCAGGHWFPVAGGIPRMLPDSLKEHWPSLKPHMAEPLPQSLREAVGSSKDAGAELDRRTRANFSEEWNNHDLGGKTWGMELDDRVNWFFLEPIRIPAGELRGKVMLDAGCGNGSQSVAYTRFGVEVIAMDLSTGLERGYAFRRLYAGGDASKVHFVQADLQRPPLAPHSVDLIHSAGVLHHTPNTLKTFRALFPLLKPGGTFYVWLYKYEPVVTPIVNSIRAITTHIPAPSFAVVAKLMSPAFQAFCAGVNALGVRSYPRLDRREAALALMDIFGAPYAHYHSFDEVKGWYDAMGFAEVWACNDGRRGFGVCGRLSGAAEEGAGG